MSAATNSTPPSRPTYPWSARRITLLPQNLLNTRNPNQPIPLTPLPFPRYGHSLPISANQNGELFIFGGLVHDSVRNELYVFNARDMGVALWQTRGEIPSPRVGHASALVNNVLIVWGGDTKTESSIKKTDKQDEGLYLLNLVNREWTRMETNGSSPAGRYGHAVTMVGTKFFVFGGQVDGEFFNDLWSFELNSLKTKPEWEWMKPVPDSPEPPKRTGHVCVAHGENIYVFGGTDGQIHYNDTWAFDLTSRRWTELNCIGFIPQPREGHAAALVDDVMYVFGGRGTDGKDLGDLAAFKITNRRWYMFQNMGPSPSGRSGHALASMGARIYVLGGESFTTPRPDDPSVVHVLDTKHIRYPDSNSKRRPSVGASTPAAPQTTPGGQAPPPPASQRSTSQPSIDHTRATSPVMSMSESEALRRAAVSPNTVQQRSIATGMGSQLPNGNGITPKGTPSSVARLLQNEDMGGSEDGSRIHGSVDSHILPQSQKERSTTPDPMGNTRVKSPTPSALARSRSPQQLQLNGPQPVNPATVALNRTALAARSPSPVVDRSAPPPDAFYPTGGKSPTGVNGLAANQTRLGSSDNVSADILREMKAELEASRKKDAWMKAALFRAIRNGFTLSEGILDQDSKPSDEGAQKIFDMLARLKHERAQIEAKLAEQARISSERCAEAERISRGALQESTFYRAKLAALESGSSDEAARLERERCNDLEKQLATLTSDRAANQRKISELLEAVVLQTRLREQAELKADETSRRADTLEDAHQERSRAHDDLSKQHSVLQASLRDHEDRLITQTSLSEQLSAEQRVARSQIEVLTTSRDQHVRALEQAQAALSAANSRAEETDQQWRNASQRVAQLELELAETKADLESRIVEVESANARLTDVENAWTKSREEADSFRALTTGGLGELLDYHRDLRADEDRATRGHDEKVQALSDELTSLRNMLKDVRDREADSRGSLEAQRSRAQNLEQEHMSLQAQLVGLRNQLSEALTDSGNLRRELQSRDAELQDKLRAGTQSELKLDMLRNYLADHGFVVDDETLGSAKSGRANRIFELENQLSERTRLHEEALHDLQVAERRHQDSASQINSLANQLSRTRTGRTPTPDQNGTAAHAEAVARIAALEQQLVDSEQAHQDRLAQMEKDYQTAVHYVKGTEKMLRRMRDELTKQKGVSATLQAELDGMRGTSPESGSRSLRNINLNGRGTPLSDDSHDTLRSQLVEAQRQNQRYFTDNSELRRRLEAVEQELDQLREGLMMSQRESEERGAYIDKLEGEFEHLEQLLSDARRANDQTFLEQLRQENEKLRQDNDQLSQRVALLLEVDPQFGRSERMSGLSDHRRSSSSENGMVFENLENFSNELDDWQRRIANTVSTPQPRPMESSEAGHLSSSGHQRLGSRS
ncbi:hypothetical protein SISSUDRAFT_990233 [Sistotremastrum suecicum HHB10207 ss-3]|uniref:Galactose oxidase n=1 Tax=Sistotremastrum suecicum HHB10207 ss-3 TaxID=1314776 RepID=A0A166ASN9_9AGAM|nr:hypothetical protein SISSUDRAFT_990233 [Sistotremastrum suecicum HHB10207 ss-3]